MNRTLAAACSALAIATVALSRPPVEGAPLRLKYVAIVSRHGVRAPTWTLDRLNQYSAVPWPDWGVPPAYLTPHGRTLMSLMGGYYREWLASEGLLRRSDCSDSGRIYVWADTDQRTLETGRALAEALLPGCGVDVHSHLGGGTDPLFDPIEAGLVTPDPQEAAKAVRGRLGAQPEKFLEPHRTAFAELHDILTGASFAKEQPFASPTDVGVATSGGAIELTGPLAPASTLSEVMLLEYGNGFPQKDLGWGRLNAQNLRRVLELHTLYADLMRRTPYLARARGSNLLAHVLRSMEQASTGTTVPGALGRPGDTVLIVSGHDTNLSNISGMLGLSWKLPGYPSDDTPPGGALIFSLWQDPGSSRSFIKARYIAQTPDQMHDAVPVTMAAPPAMQDVAIPGCGSGCDWPSFARVVKEAIDPAATH